MTVAEVTAAADVLERMSTIYGLHSPEYAEWCASDLRAELPTVEDLEAQARVRRQIAVEIQEKVYQGLDVLDAATTVLSGYEVSPNEEL